MQMLIYMIILCGMALLFLVASPKMKTSWIAKSFILYSSISMLSILGIGGYLLYENREVIRAYMAEEFLVEANEAPPVSLAPPSQLVRNIHLDVPSISQLPELPRGCEVTSLAMLLQYNDYDADKLALAKQIKKSPAPIRAENGKIMAGNPNAGFVGDMYSYDKPGFGVYHKPIAELAYKYAGDSVHDFTGGDFEEIFSHLMEGRPVWVIINTEYDELTSEFFQFWMTEEGPIEITYKEHAVVVTGFDDKYIYFNDPLERVEKAPIEEFKKAWEQMGKQAITILPQ